MDECTVQPKHTAINCPMGVTHVHNFGNFYSIWAFLFPYTIMADCVNSTTLLLEKKHLQRTTINVVWADTCKDTLSKTGL